DAIRRAPESKWSTPVLEKYALLTGERLKTIKSVIPPHPTRPDATEGKTGLAWMEYAVIYSYTTGRGTSDYLVRALPVIVEIVERERVWPRINVCEGFLHGTVFHNR